MVLENLGDIVSEKQETMVVIDNMPAHNNASIRHACHEIVKLTPYSPMLNPIEMAFSMIKACVKQDLNSRSQLRHSTAARADTDSVSGGAAAGGGLDQTAGRPSSDNG